MKSKTTILVMAWALINLVLLALLEAWTVVVGQPTISAALQSLNDAAPVFGLSVAVLSGILLDHFFGRRST